MGLRPLYFKIMNVGTYTVKWTYSKDFVVQHRSNKQRKETAYRKRMGLEKVSKTVQQPRDITLCEIFDKEGKMISSESVVRLWSDIYCKDTARKLSMEKALASSELDRKARGTFWEVYRLQTKTPKWNLKVKIEDKK